MAQPRGCLGLAFGTVRGFALARHDLQGHVEAGVLVAGEPHRAGCAAPERPQRAVAIEDELPGREYGKSGGHVFVGLAAAGETPSAAFPAEAVVTVARIELPTA